MAAFSIYTYTATGSPQVVAVPPHISRSHIAVVVDGTVASGYEWLTELSIRLTAPAGAVIKVRRSTSPEARLVDYQDGVPLTADLLNIDSLQTFYLTQEAYDIYDGVLVPGDTAPPPTPAPVDATYTAPGTGGALRTLQDRGQEIVYVTDYMSNAQKADAKARTVLLDCLPAFQAATAYCLLVGATLCIPAGTYRHNGAWTINQSGITSDTSKLRVNIEGDGQSTTLIYSTGGLVYRGGLRGTEGQNAYCTIQGFAVFHNGGKTGIGLDIDTASLCLMADLNIGNFSTGIQGTNVLDLRAERVNPRGNLIGMYLFPNGADPQLNPNAITLEDCAITGNNQKGLVVLKPSTLQITGGVNEANGWGNPTTGIGIEIISAGAEGAAGVNIEGVYFEANSGKADILFTHGATNCTYRVSGCTFNRTDSRPETGYLFTTNNIRLDIALAHARVNIESCGFRGFAPNYTADASRKYVAVNRTGGTYLINDETSWYDNPVEKPVFAGRHHTVQSRVGAWCSFKPQITNTTFFYPNPGGIFAPDSGYNVDTVSVGGCYKLAVGDFQVNFIDGLVNPDGTPNNFPAVSVMCNVAVTTGALLIPVLVTAGNASVRVQFRDVGGVLRDPANVITVTVHG